jgi:hypothetical protein
VNGCLADQHCVDRWRMRFRGYAEQLRHDTHRLHVETVARRDGNIVVEDGCSLTGFDSRVPPSRAIELTAVFLDRNATAILAHRPKGTASRQQTQELAAIIHLCGAGPAKGFARRGFRPIAAARCGDQEVATYLVQINAMTREFLRLAAER